MSLNPPPSAGGLLIGFGLRLLEPASPPVWQDALATSAHLLAAMSITNAARADIDEALHDESLDPIEQARQFLSDD